MFPEIAMLAGSTLANGFMQQRAAAYNQRMTEKNTAANYRYAMLSQRNAPINEVYGLKAAGLSPTFANGAQGMAVSQGASGSAQAPEVNPANALMLAQLENINAQTSNIQAQTDKTEAEKQQIDLALGHAYSLDESLTRNLPHMFAEMANDSRYSDDMRKLFAEAAKDSSDIGGLKGLQAYLDTRVQVKEALNKELSSRFDWNLQVAKLDDPQLIKTLVKMPQAQRENIVALSGKYIQEVANLAQTAETEVSKRQKIGAEIGKIMRETQSILHRDGAQMWKEKDTQGLLWLMGSGLAGAAEKIGTAAVMK